jgi:hypothetical protein
MRSGAAALWALCAALGCAPREPRDLRARLALASALDVAVPAGADTLLARRAARELALATGRTCEIVDPTAPGERGRPRLAVAGVDDGWVRPVLAALGVEREPNGAFVFADRIYTAAGDAVVATLPDPERTGLPLTVCISPRPREAAGFLGSLRPAWRIGVRCWRDGEIEREGWLRSSGAIAWSSASDLRAERERRTVAVPTRLRFELVVRAPPGLDPQPVARDAIRRAGAVEAAVARLLSVESQGGAPLRLVGHAGAEAFALATGEWSSARSGPAAGELHVLLDEKGMAGAWSVEFARAQALYLAGEPAEDWMLDGVAVLAAGEWWGRGLDGWIERVASRELARDVGEIVGDDPRVSPHVASPLRAALLEAIAARDGSGAIARAWRGERAYAEAELETFFDRIVADAEAARRARGAAPRDAALCAPVRAGAHLAPAHDAAARSAGLGTAACARSLEALRALGAGAVAIAPTYYATPDPPDFTGDFLQRPFATDAPDVAVAATIARARSLGMGVMLAPQLLDSPSGTWSACGRSHTAAAYDEMFADLRACLVHAALVAELGGAEILCLGSELAPATRSVFSDEELPWIPDHIRRNRERWSEIVRAVRAAYSGALVYAAGSVAEARDVEFWSELDFVGIDLYRNLELDGARPDDAHATARLRGHLEQALELARQHGKRLIVCEVGFAPTGEAWRATERTAGAFDPAEQARLWHAFAAALRRLGSARADLAGVYAWCWSTEPDGRASSPRSFAVTDPAAREALGAAFAALR